MELIVAETAGFCMGVDMALHKLDNALANLPQGCMTSIPWGPSFITRRS
jgi:4-hydroxy-3-methylbut-2-enyl diphosphate reductase IspH